MSILGGPKSSSTSKEEETGSEPKDDLPARVKIEPTKQIVC